MFVKQKASFLTDMSMVLKNRKAHPNHFYDSKYCEMTVTQIENNHF